MDVKRTKMLVLPTMCLIVLGGFTSAQSPGLGSGSCANTPCLNSGTCFESAKQLVYMCVCQVGYSGVNCEIGGEPEPSSSGSGSTGSLSPSTDRAAGTGSQIMENCPPDSVMRIAIPEGSTYASASQGEPRMAGTSQYMTIDKSPDLSSLYLLVGDEFPVTYRFKDISGAVMAECSFYVIGVEASGACQNSPCNTGECVDTGVEGKGYTCKCPNGVSGDNCEQGTQPAQCTPMTCLNGGTCTTDNNEVSCTCAPGFMGQYCQTTTTSPGGPSTGCTTQTCLNGGTCFDTDNGVSCVCSGGYTGPVCEFAFLDLEPPTIIDCPANMMFMLSPGQSMGSFMWTEPTATDNDGSSPSRSRTHAPGQSIFYPGSYAVSYKFTDQSGNIAVCTFTVTVAASSPGEPSTGCTTLTCRNGGTCTDTANGAFCTCILGFTGPLCETDIVPGDGTPLCTATTCHNGGICYDTSLGAVCACFPRYTGLYCETELDNGGDGDNDVCKNNMCLNGATCVPSSGGDSGSVDPWDRDDHYPRDDTDRDHHDRDHDRQRRGGSRAGHGHGGHHWDDDRRGYTCLCQAGFRGLNCEYSTGGGSVCQSNPCHNGGSCTESPYAQFPGRYSCSCPPGFTGRNCETSTGGGNRCLYNVCLNGGSCTLNYGGYGGYSCSCPQGFTGSNCETSLIPVIITPCLSNPCQNGATCTNSTTGYSCTCAVGFTGRNCQYTNGPGDDTQCTLSCQNGGSCIAAFFRDYCLCATGYSGQFCEIDTGNRYPGYYSACEPNPCRNGGRCTCDYFARSGYYCTCPEGFTGLNCETRLAPVPAPVNPTCLRSPCMNGGTCTNSTTGYSCTCAVGFTGRNCQDRTSGGNSACSPNPCMNNALCVPSSDGSYICRCQQGYYGPNCGLAPVPAPVSPTCLRSPCMNGGTCTNSTTGYSCTCAVGFTGRNCQDRTSGGSSACSPNPCMNNALCVPSSDGSYICRCQQGYYGPNCDLDVEPPKIFNCTGPNTTMLAPGQNMIPVRWNEPRATDNDGQTPIMSRSRVPGQSFGLGSHLVSYTFTDQSGNKATCTFAVTVTGFTSPCQSSPCMMGATCINGNMMADMDATEYFCFCPPGFNGSCDQNSVDARRRR